MGFKKHTSALDFAVAFKACFAFADIVGGEVTTLGILDTLRSEDGVGTFVNIGTFVSIPSVTFTTGTKVTTEGIGAIGKDVTWPIFALIVIGHIATLTPVTIVTMTLTIQTRAVFTITACRITTIICKGI